MSKRKVDYLLEDMKVACDKILNYTSGMDHRDFEGNDLVTDAVIRNLQVLGEAANQVSKDFRSSVPEIEWEKIIRSRHVVVHHYFGLDLDIIWRIVTDYIPPLAKELEKIVTLGDDQ